MRTVRLLGFCALLPWSLSAWSCAVEEDIPDFEEPLLEEQACNTPTNYTISNCSWQTAYDKIMYPTSAGSFTVTDASYGVGTCTDRAVIRTINTNEQVWFDHLSVQLAAGSVPTTACGCAEVMISLEWEEYACTSHTLGCYQQGHCSETTEQNCCSVSGCPSGEGCVGFTPGQTITQCSDEPLIQRATAYGVWNPLIQKCNTFLAISRQNPPDYDYFMGVEPQFRAGAINRVTGAELPVTVTARKL
jgi:hypothetical protein